MNTNSWVLYSQFPWAEQRTRQKWLTVNIVHRISGSTRNKSLTISSSDFIFRKYKQDSAFHVSGVLQLAKTGPLVMKNKVPLLRLFLSVALMAWRFYTPYDVNCTNLHILTAHGMSHILTPIGQLWSSRKNLYALVSTFFFGSFCCCHFYYWLCRLIFSLLFFSRGWILHLTQ